MPRAATSDRPTELRELLPHPYRLAERTLDLFLAPGRLFRTPPGGLPARGAGLLSAAVLAVTSLLSLETSELETPAWLAALALATALAGFWLHLLLVALSGLAFGGMVGRDLPFRTWLGLAAHCSLVGLATLPAGLAAQLWAPGLDLQLGLADLLEDGASALVRSFLSHVTLHTVAFLSLFALGSATFTGASRARALAFTFGVWGGLWFMLAWFASGVA